MTAAHALLNSVSIFSDTFRYLQLSKKRNADLQKLKLNWGRHILQLLHVDVETLGTPSSAAATLYVGNHISYIDIPLLMSRVPRISFVAKQELARWPVFGAGARKIDTVFVKREQSQSRHSARQSLREALLDGKRVAVFPSGTTCMEESRSWRWGAFQIAHELKIPVQPFRITYSPLRMAAYIDRDFFPLHLLQVSRQRGMKATIEFHAPISVTNPQHDCEFWQKWTQEGLHGTKTFEL